MRILCCLVILGLGVSSSVIAQQVLSMGAEIDMASHFSPSYNIGYGTNLEYERYLTRTVAVRTSLGFTYLASNVQPGFISFMPARVGVQGYLSPSAFVFGEGGVAYFRSFASAGKTGLSLAVGVGHRKAVGTRSHVQLSALYNYFRNPSGQYYTWFALRAALGLSWGTKVAASVE